MRCLICRKLADRHHIKTRGSGGTDDDFNIALLCRQHHQEIHRAGLTTFAEKYPRFKEYLLSNGWEFNQLMSKWKHY